MDQETRVRAATNDQVWRSPQSHSRLAVAYRVFLPTKRAVLMSLLTRELGSSGLRAGIASTLLPRSSRLNPVKPDEAATEELEALLRGEGAVWTSPRKTCPRKAS
ncbi:hypothetical protein PG988_008013 [Apiospora saccharicola]